VRCAILHLFNLLRPNAWRYFQSDHAVTDHRDQRMTEGKKLAKAVHVRPKMSLFDPGVHEVQS
jgi:hypothetical protein